MVRVASSEFGKEIRRYQDLALSQPVIVTGDGLDRTVLISAEEYFRLTRRDRQVFASGELPAEMVEAVGSTRMDERHNHLNELVKDWIP